MSWLTDFTSKAENLLTKFDQTAAQTFNDSSENISNVTATPNQVSALQHSSTPHTNTINTSASNYQTAGYLIPQTQQQQQQQSLNKGASSTVSPTSMSYAYLKKTYKHLSCT